MGIAAVNTGNNLIYLLVAALLSLLSVSGFFGRYNLQNLELSLQAPDEVYAGCETPLSIQIRNRRTRYPAFLLKAECGDATVLFSFLPPNATTSALIDWRWEERGRHQLPRFHLASPFPFSFFIRYRELPLSVARVIVMPHPRLGPFPRESAYARRRQGDSERQDPGFEGEFISVRDYQAGDPLRFIHWKASARTGNLKTKDLGMSESEPLLLNFDALPGGDVEKKLSHICHLIKKTMKNTQPVGLRIGGLLYHPEPSREHKRKLLKALAVYGSNETPLQS